MFLIQVSEILVNISTGNKPSILKKPICHIGFLIKIKKLIIKFCERNLLKR
mgnify:CR=1 FL=1